MKVDPNPRCQCGKVIYLHQERAAFAAVQYAVFYGVAMRSYQCRIHDRFWHLGTMHSRIQKKRWKREVGEHRWLNGSWGSADSCSTDS